jgi:UDP-N-acetylmuramoyl-tripeptide--D-alanyl-D-alanine ligase
MPELKLAELAEATGGSLLKGDPQSRVGSYAIDTRQLEKGGAFFALAGTKTDGHEFLDHATERGAAAAVVQQEPVDGTTAPPALIKVEDTVDALGRCGSWVRKRLKNTKWIAVTGSNGKTTTKELLAEGLSASRRVHRTPGNFNNHLGVPLTLLHCPTDTEFAVVEMGMNRPGEIATLTGMAKPDIALVTNVRAAHLEFFGSLDDIAAAKGELFALLAEDAVAVVNLDDAHVRVQAARHPGPRVTFGQHQGADLRLEEMENRFIPGTAFTYRHRDQSHRMQLRMGGAHSAFNALAALAAITAVGEELGPAAERMEQLEAGPGRGKVHLLPREMILIDDSYNCSPAALASVLETLRLCEPPGRKVMVMGDMLELGRIESALHREAGKRAAASGVQLLVAVGPLSRVTAETARRAGVPEVHHHADSTKAAESITEFLKDGDLIVVKGSRGMRMERVVEALLQMDGGES